MGHQTLGREGTIDITDKTAAKRASAVAGGGIPLDLAPLLKPHARHRRLALRVEKLPALARLSKGSHNDDRSWSLTRDDLEGLELQILEDAEPPQVLPISIVAIDDNDNASIVSQFDLPLAEGQKAAMPTDSDSPAPAAPVDWQRKMDRRVAAAQRLSKRQSELALRKAEARWLAESEKQLAQKVGKIEKVWRKNVDSERAAREQAEAEAESRAQELTGLNSKLEAVQARLADAEAAARDASDLRRSDRKSEADLAEELERRIAAARTEWEKDSEDRLAVAVKEARQESEAAAEARLEEARAQWRKQSENEIEAVRYEAAEAESSALRLDIDVTAEKAACQAESERRLAEKTEELEQAWRQKLEAERSAREAAEREAKENAKELTKLTDRLDVALAKVAVAEAAAARRDGEMRQAAQAAEARLDKELEEQLAAARTGWEAESEARVAAAVTQAARESEAAANARLEKERAHWREQSERDIEALKETCAQAEAAAERIAGEMAAAERVWQSQNEALLSEQAERLETALAEAAASEAAAAQRESEMQRSAEEAQARLTKELQEKSDAARIAWEQESEARLSEQAERLEKAWQEKILAERGMREKAETRAAESDQELGVVRDRLETALAQAAASEAAAAQRESEMQRSAEEAQARLTKELQEKSAAARIAWEQESEARHAAAVRQAVQQTQAAAEAQFEEERGRWRKQAEHDRAEVAAALAAKEAALSEARREATRDEAAAPAETDAATVQDLKQDLEQAREQWERESRAALEQAEEKWRAEEVGRLAAARAEWQKSAPSKPVGSKSVGSTGAVRSLAKQQRGARAWRHIRRVAVVAGCLAAAFVAYGELKPTLIGKWKPKAAALVSDIESAALSRLQTLSNVATPRMTVAASVANLRGGPSTAATLVAKLPRGTVVSVLEQRDGWVRVQIDGETAQQGWLHRSLLGDAVEG